ncbi:MAG TPA: hypothetical protein VGN72_10645 [Tepidisphaeraceae bacterium]|jgi:hypothetical protein|nr:hypothetical protein [Tepidisphaeraceae bacterium]
METVRKDIRAKFGQRRLELCTEQHDSANDLRPCIHYIRIVAKHEFAMLSDHLGWVASLRDMIEKTDQIKQFVMAVRERAYQARDDARHKYMVEANRGYSLVIGAGVDAEHLREQRTAKWPRVLPVGKLLYGIPPLIDLEEWNREERNQPDPRADRTAVHHDQAALRALVRLLDRTLAMLAIPELARPRAEGTYFENDMREAAGLSTGAGFPKPPVVFTDVSCTLYDINGMAIFGAKLELWEQRPASEYQEWRARSLIPHLHRWRAVANDRLDDPIVAPAIAGPPAPQTPPSPPPPLTPPDPIAQMAERYLVLARDAAYTTVEQIAEQLGKEFDCGRSTVFKRLGRARKAGLLPRKERKPKEWTNQMQQIDPTRGSGRQSA